MATPGASNSLDPLLIPFFEADEGMAAEDALADLIARQAEPLVNAILRRLLQRTYSRPAERDDLEDVHGQVLVRVLARLRALRSRGHSGIGNFRDYVAVTTYRTYYEYLRERYPERHRLKSRLRHVLKEAAALALWERPDGGWLAGLAHWRGRPRSNGLALAPADLPALPPPPARSRGRLAEFLVRLFDRVGDPMELDDLVDVMAGIESVPAPADVNSGRRTVAGPWAAPEVAQADDRIFLHQVWAEIQRLPLPQRKALLLNLRDAQGRDLIALLPVTGVATLREIADVLAMPAEELADLWARLPLDDQALADLLELSRQQVINLRGAARRRLARRLKLGGGGSPAARGDRA